MSKYVKNQSSTDPWLIDESGQTWTLGKNATIAVDGMTAIHAGIGHDGNTIRLNGDVVVTGAGEMGVYLQGDDTTLKIGKASQIEAYAGVVSGSSNGMVRNAGNVDGEAYGILLDDPNELVNKGEISGNSAVSTIAGSEIINLKGGLIDGGNNGIYVVENEATTIENRGTIRADDAAIRFADGASGSGSVLVNTGRIVGDVLFGAGDDWVDNRTGRINGMVNGGNGNDTYVIGKHGGQLSEQYDNGWDEVESTRSFTLGDNLEELRLLGKKSIDATGNDASNTVFGNAGDNIVRGEGGSDFVGGGGGMDQLFGGEGADDFVFSKGDGRDTVKDFDVSEDQILLLDFGFDAFDGVVSLMSQHGADTWISLGKGDRLIIENVNMGDLVDEMINFDYTVIAVV